MARFWVLARSTRPRLVLPLGRQEFVLLTEPRWVGRHRSVGVDSEMAFAILGEDGEMHGSPSVDASPTGHDANARRLGLDAPNTHPTFPSHDVAERRGPAPSSNALILVLVNKNVRRHHREHPPWIVMLAGRRRPGPR
jgi:hypothetical protein